MTAYTSPTLQLTAEQIEEKTRQLDEIHEMITDTFYERQHSRYLVRKDTFCGSELDALMEKIEQFLGVPKP